MQPLCSLRSLRLADFKPHIVHRQTRTLNTSTNYGAGAMGNLQTDAGRCREGAKKRQKRRKERPSTATITNPIEPAAHTQSTAYPHPRPVVGRPGQSSCSVSCCCSSELRPISASFSHSQRKKPAQHHFRKAWGEGFDCAQYYPYTCSNLRCRRNRCEGQRKRVRQRERGTCSYLYQTGSRNLCRPKIDESRDDATAIK